MLAVTDFEWESRAVKDAWTREGRHLAHELQDELPDVDVRYWEDGDPRPMRDRRRT